MEEGPLELGLERSNMYNSTGGGLWTMEILGFNSY